MVTDATGAVLPGVTAEARSPALIEQVRSAVTDAQGKYRLVDLRPGVYTVTFTLPGFSTVVREGIQLEANFTAPLNIEMRVGAIEETVTVSGASPVVDVQSTQRREVLTRELIDVLPTGRNYSTVAVAIPSVTSTVRDVGGITAAGQGQVRAYGGQGAQAVMMDGLRIDGVSADGVINLFYNAGAVEEFVYQVNGGNAETPSSYVVINQIPRSGGNAFNGWALFVKSGPSLSSSNITAEQRANGLLTSKVAELHDYNGGVGGPIRRDRLWFYTSPREWEQATTTPWLHDGLLGPAGTPIVDRALHRAWTNRLTWQLNNPNKIAGTYEYLQKTNFNSGLSGSTRPEATNIYGHRPFFYTLTKWTSVLKNKVFIEAGYSLSYKDYYMHPQPGIPPDAAAKQDVGRNVTFGNTSRYIDHWQRHDFVVGSVTYVTGSHSIKGGVQWDTGYDEVANYSSNGSLTQVYRNGVPFSVNVYDFPSLTQANVMNSGAYLQDSWTLHRLTLNPGLRWDQFVGSLPDLSMPAGRFVPARHFADIGNLPNWKNLAPRFGASFDLSGNGKTALKGSAGKYMIQFGSGLVFQYNPSNSASVATPDPRDWTDLNGDDIAQDNEIGLSRNASWGIQPNRRPDQERSYDLLYNAAIDHEVSSGLGLSVAYNRRDTKNISWADNLTNVPEDWQKLTVADPRGNGSLLEVYQILPGRVGPSNTVDRTSNNTRSWDGVDFTLRGRVHGTTFTAGTSTGRTKLQTCQVENLNELRFCEQKTPYQTNFKVSGTYPLPWYGFRASLVYQSLPGIERVVNYVVTRAQLPQLTTASSVTVRLNEPGTEFLPRFNQVDLSLAGSIKVRRFRVKPQVDFFNMLNTNAVNAQTTSFPTQGRATAILPGRIVRVGSQLDF